MKLQYFQNNQKKSEGNVSGVDKEDYSPFREGKWTTWYETGEKESEIADHFSSGKKNGFLTEWFKNGKKQSVHFCEDGRMITMFVWDEDGTDITAKVYEDADRFMRETDERRQQRGIKTTLHKRNISLEGRNIPLTDDEKELGADFWSDIYGDDFIDDDPF